MLDSESRALAFEASPGNRVLSSFTIIVLSGVSPIGSILTFLILEDEDDDDDDEELEDDEEEVDSSAFLFERYF